MNSAALFSESIGAISWKNGHKIVFWPNDMTLLGLLWLVYTRFCAIFLLE